jgi:hypothetical protein
MSYDERLRQMAGLANVPLNTSKDVRPTPIIEGQVKLLEERIDCALNAVCELEQRLQPALHTVPETAEKNSGTAVSTGVPLGDALSLQCDRLVSIITRLRHIHSRIEL